MSMPIMVKPKATLLYQFSGQECSLTISPSQRWLARIHDNTVSLSHGFIQLNVSKEKFNQEWEEF